jgi:DUF2934 family protein
MAKSSTTPSTRKRTTKKPNGGAVEPNGAQPPDVDFNGLSAGGITEDDIRTRAYHRYLERGGGHGADFDDWLEAERELKAPRHN